MVLGDGAGDAPRRGDRADAVRVPRTVDSDGASGRRAGLAGRRRDPQFAAGRADRCLVHGFIAWTVASGTPKYLAMLNRLSPERTT